MRNGQQQKRMRGRNNNRRGSNPLTRVYESNGPDVKVRGTAHHIAEKYQQLARDAQSSGDPVAAENYFQHAEHYLRLIASLQGQFAPQAAYGRDEEGDEEDVQEDVSGLDAPQPYMREQSREAREPREPRENSRNRDFRENRDRDNRDRDYREREPRQSQPRRAPRTEEDSAPQVHEPAGEDEVAEVIAPVPVPAAAAPAPARTRAPRQPRTPRAEPRAEGEDQLGLPSFITGAPVVARETRAAKAAAAPAIADEAEDGLEDTGEPRAGRRRRRYRSRLDTGEEAGSESNAEAEPQVAVNE